MIGTPPNLVLASYAESQLGRPIGFAEWMRVGVPVTLAGLAVATTAYGLFFEYFAG